jgi:hypothetical protein
MGLRPRVSAPVDFVSSDYLPHFRHRGFRPHGLLPPAVSSPTLDSPVAGFLHISLVKHCRSHNSSMDCEFWYRLLY